MCSFRLNARRFVQELFEDFKLKKVCFFNSNLRNACGFWFYKNQMVHLFFIQIMCTNTERERCLTNKCITEKNTCTLPHLEDYVKLYCNDHLYWYLHCYFIETTCSDLVLLKAV